jgi:DNA-binding transcriptional ArsR family regulator
MPVRYELAGQDLGGVRFAISPLGELVLSLRGWRDPGRYPLQLPWIRETRSLRDRLDAEVLFALVNERLWTPDFLTPHPRSPLTRIEDEFAALAATPAVTVEGELETLHPAGRPAVLRGPGVLARIVGALEGYWDLCFAPYWQKVRALLEADVTYRGRQAAQYGLAAMVAALSPRVSMEGDVVEVRVLSRLDYARRTAGGLTLIPSLWTSAISTPISAAEAPMIIYLARGGGMLWEPQSLPAPGALAALLGAHRAGLLTQLADPASSTELAVRLGVTTAAVNQHLRALRAAGLLLSARHGRSVLYRRSDLGDNLVNASGGTS